MVKNLRGLQEDNLTMAGPDANITELRELIGHFALMFNT
jgi:hypothetical protein